MDDLISRQAAINEILDDLKDTSLHDDPATPEDFAECYDEGIRNAAAIVLQMPPAQPGWIPCSERLPKLNGYYLTTIKWGEDFYEVDVYEYDSYYKEWNEGEYFGGTVVAWMPLPTPYREGGQDG